MDNSKRSTPIGQRLYRCLLPDKPLTDADLRAREYGKSCLQLAQSYHAGGDLLNAVSWCIEGLDIIRGISRPLMVRDQLRDLLQKLDPDQNVSLHLKQPCYRTLPPAKGRPQVTPTYLERLVSVHQLLVYPSEYTRFNRVYQEAFECLESTPTIREVYIVQYRSRIGALSNGEELYFSFVPAALISDKGPYYLTDICAVLRK